MKNKCIIFDMDGTIIDSIKVWFGFANLYLEQVGINLDYNVDSEVIHFSLSESIKYLKDKFKINKTLETIDREMMNLALMRYDKYAKIKEGVFVFLSYLKENNYNIYLATVARYDLAIRVLKRFQLDSFFDNILSVEDLDTNKTNTKVFDECLKLSGCKKEKTIIFEDSLEVIKILKKSGYKTVGVFDNYNKQNTEEIKEYSDFYIKDFNIDNLKKILNNLN